MDLQAFGIDTVRLAWEADNPLPISDSGYQLLLADLGWNVQSALMQDNGEVRQSHKAMWQSAENDTLRVGIQNAGRTVWAEFSAPRLLDDSPVNTGLATPRAVLDLSRQLRGQLAADVPEFCSSGEVRFRRCDLAADIAAGANYPGLIAAASHFRIPRARKVTRSVFPGETSRVSAPSMTVRTYDKTRELKDKTADILAALSADKRDLVQKKISEYQSKGVARLELAMTPKGGVSMEQLRTANIKWADIVSDGFSMDGNAGVLYIGGLQRIRQQVDGMDLHPASRSSLLAFAVRYAELGEDGMKAAYSRPTYFRHKKKFLDLGLALDDITKFHGELDFNPVLKKVRAM